MNQATPHEGLHVASATREDARRRLLSIKGHVEGILRMLDDEQVYCVDILKQIRAVDGALDKVGDLVLRSHLGDHVVTAHERGDVSEIVDGQSELFLTDLCRASPEGSILHAGRGSMFNAD